MSQVTEALTAVNEARAMEESLEKQKGEQRERVLKEANEELIRMVHHLLDKQTSLKVQLDKHAWEAKERQDKREAHLKAFLATLPSTDEIQEQEAWRKELHESNQEVASRVNALLEKARVLEEQQRKTNPILEKAKAEALNKAQNAKEATNTKSTITTNSNNSSISSSNKRVSSSSPSPHTASSGRNSKNSGRIIDEEKKDSSPDVGSSYTHNRSVATNPIVEKAKADAMRYKTKTKPKPTTPTAPPTPPATTNIRTTSPVVTSISSNGIELGTGGNETR